MTCICRRTVLVLLTVLAFALIHSGAAVARPGYTMFKEDGTPLRAAPGETLCRVCGGATCTNVVVRGSCTVPKAIAELRRRRRASLQGRRPRSAATDLRSRRDAEILRHFAFNPTQISIKKTVPWTPTRKPGK